MVVPKKQKQTSASTDDTKVVPRGQQTARHDRLKSMLKRMVTQVADAKQPYAESFFVTNSEGAQVTVCKAFFMACFGYKANGKHVQEWSREGHSLTIFVINSTTVS